MNRVMTITGIVAIIVFIILFISGIYHLATDYSLGVLLIALSFVSVIAVMILAVLVVLVSGIVIDIVYRIRGKYKC